MKRKKKKKKKKKKEGKSQTGLWADSIHAFLVSEFCNMRDTDRWRNIMHY